ncbi:GtrA family protein [Rhodoblastus sp.]|uniref:GtrA family protein n=1 Tax=Rhodoblastus sp. TaxID=1962975 RepID=UPI003F9D8954
MNMEANLPRVADLWRSRPLRFIIVGAINTLFGYGLFFIFVVSGMSAALALAAATVAGVVFNYFTIGAVVFSQSNPRRFWRFAMVYSVIYAANATALECLRTRGVTPIAAQAALLPVFVGLAYVFNRALVFMGDAKEGQP